MNKSKALTSDDIARDLVQREATEAELQAALRNAELRHRQIVDCASDTIYRITPSGHFTFVNRSAAALVRRSVEECVGLHFLDLVREDYRGQAAQFYRDQIAEKIPVTYFEFPALAKDGSEVWIGQNVQLVIEGGAVVELQGIARDITTRKEIEERLLESEHRYRLLFDSNPLPVWVYDLETLAFLAVNDAAIDHYGYSREEFLAMAITDIRPDEDIPTLLKNIPTVGARVEWSSNWRHRKKDGTIIDVEITSDALEFTGRPARIVLVSDITDRMRAEEARRQTEQQYESLVNSIEGIVWEADPQTFRFTFVSRQAERLLGYPIAQWLEGPSFWADHIHPDDRDWALDFCQQATRSGKDHQFEYRMIAADERVVWLRDNVTISVMEDGSVRLRGVMLDITERKHVEEALRESQQWLAAVYDSSRDGIIVEESERIVYVNQSYAQLFGYETDELIGRPVSLVSEQEPSERMLEYSRRRVHGACQRL